MTLFTFEVLRRDGSILAGDQRDLADSKDLWGHLEVIAIQLRRHRDLLLLVRDKDHDIVALSGIASVIDSLERCPKAACPIKRLLEGSDEETGACAPCMSIAVLDIPRWELPDALFHAPMP